MADKKRSFRGFFIEAVVPAVLYVWIAPLFMSDIWANVKADPTTPLTTYFAMHALTIAIGVCWMQIYNHLRVGLFPPNQRR
jgi:uncharacterized membrane protein